jgi:hypothetical protein
VCFAQQGFRNEIVGQLRMGVFTCWRWLFGSAGMIGSCLVFLLAPATARAGCGGDVHDIQQSGDVLTHLNPHTLASLLFSDPRESAALPDRHKPCSGPGCSRNPVAPFQAPTSPPTSDRSEHWGCLPLLLGEPRDDLAAALPGDYPLHTLDQVAYIFHPPRLI